MKYLLFFSFLLIALSAQSQTLQERGQNLKETVQDSVSNKAQAIKKQITDSLRIIMDSGALKHTKEEATNIAKDTILSLTKTGAKAQYIQDIKNQAIRYSADSSILKQIKPIAEQAVRDTINNHVEIPTIQFDTTIVDQIKQKAEAKAKSTLEHETKIKFPNITIDSTLDKQAMSEAEVQARTAVERQVGTDIPDDIAIDSTTTTNLKKEAIKQSENALKETEALKSLNVQENSEIKKVKGYQDKLAQSQEKIKQAAAQQKIKQKMATQAKQYITAHADKIQEAQSRITALKQKYSNLPNSNDLTSAVKRTSLKGEPIWERLIIGGNFNIGRTNPLLLDLSPVLGYKVNMLFDIGVTGTFRKKIKSSNAVNAKDNEAFGFGVFANHAIYRNFFGYIEGERMRIKPKKNTSTINFNDENMNRKWEQALLIGIGRNFKIARWLEMQALVLLNVLHDNQDHLYSSPVIFKTGFRLKLP